MSNELIPMSDIEKMAAVMAKSQLFGVKNPDQAMALMLIAHAEGRHPALAALDYDIVQGRPAKRAEAMLRDFQTAGGKVEWHTLTDDKADATFTHDSGGSVRIDWTMDRAKKAGLTSNPTWTKYPRAMLRSRCVSEGVRTTFPRATGGMYDPNEERDIDRPPMKDVTPKATKGDVPKIPAEKLQELAQTADIETASLSEAEDALQEAEVVSASGSEALTAYFNSLSAAVKDGMKALPNGGDRIKTAMRNAKQADQAAA